MAHNRWKLSYIALMMSTLVLLTLYPASPTFAASRSLYDNAARHQLNHTDTLTPTYGTVTLSPTSLNGSNQTLTITIPVQVLISSATAWHLQIGLTPLASGSYTLPTSLHVGLTGTCNAFNDHNYCAWYIFNNGVCYHIGLNAHITAYSSITSITASGSSPGPVTVYEDSAGCTSGTITFTTTLTATLLAKNTYAGIYSDEIQASVIAGP